MTGKCIVSSQVNLKSDLAEPNLLIGFCCRKTLTVNAWNKIVNVIQFASFCLKVIRQETQLGPACTAKYLFNRFK